MLPKYKPENKKARILSDLEKKINKLPHFKIDLDEHWSKHKIIRLEPKRPRLQTSERT